MEANDKEMVRMETHTATSRSCQLSNLPCDLLDTITCRLHHLDIANLWFIGCKTLNAKLAKGGVSQLTVKMLPASKPLHWPSMWTQLNLLLRFELDNWKKEFITIEELRSLPAKLKELRLDSQAAFPSIQQLLSQNPDSFATLELLEMQIHVQDILSEGALPLWPRSLLSLTLNSSGYPRLPLHLPSLPQSLTYLKGDFKEILNSPPTAFPPPLTSLQLRLQNLGCDPVPLLPASLKLLSLTVTSVDPSNWHVLQTWAGDSLAQLPRSLTFLNWPLSIYTQESMQLLPPTLETLQTIAVKVKDWRFLPPSITHCSACAFGRNFAPPDCVQQIPPSLKSFAVTTRALPHVKSAHSKNGVSVRVCSSNGELKEEMVALNMSVLDSSITSITCVGAVEQHLLEVLPMKLTHLRLDSEVIAEERLDSLPCTLKRLEFPNVKLKEETWKLLPRNLENLTLGALPVILYTKSASWLPKTLTQMMCMDSEKPVPLAWFGGLPRGLQELSLEIALDVFPSGPIAASPCFSLPPNLVDLSFRIQNASTEIERITERMHNLIISLPPRLQSFSIDHAKVFFVTIPYHLFPKRLARLRLPKEIITSR